MTKEEILEQQVEALEKLIQLKSAIIDEQDKKIEKLKMELAMEQLSKVQVPNWQPHVYTPQPPYYYPSPIIGPGNTGTITIPNPTCTDGKQHEYPAMWGGSNPPPCSKCGAQSAVTGWSTISTNITGSNVDVVGSTTIDISGQQIPAIATSGYIAPAEDTNVFYLAAK